MVSSSRKEGKDLVETSSRRIRLGNEAKMPPEKENDCQRSI